MSIYDTLNKEQKEAVYCTEGPLLLLAGAGSGKTRVLVHRICYLIEEKGVNPWNIMAITFTNKAAGEMRERVDELVGYDSSRIWVSTFHSTCVRILRKDAELLGYSNNFTIYDTDDQKTLIKDVYRRLDIDSKQFPEKNVLSEISKAKDRFISPGEYLENIESSDYRRQKIARIYAKYQEMLHENNAMDFDDLIYKTVELLSLNKEVLAYYQNRFMYIMVDEYQDTNNVQFKLIKLLAGTNQNLCVVGDDDQSIYKFRGADITNILNFEAVYPTAKTIKLEQNYRSTKNILNAANGVIAHNKGRKEKSLWSEKEEGEQISFRQYESDLDEADRVVIEIANLHDRKDYHYGDIAILNRTNAQSRVYEEKFLMRNIPYKIVGGVNFYSRKEIKDVLAYLKTIANGDDDLAVKRIINVPRRGIGATSIARVQDYAIQREIGFLDGLYFAQDVPSIGAAAKKIATFTNMITDFREKAKEFSLLELYDYVIEATGYTSGMVLEATEEANARLENLDELKNKIADYENEQEEPTLEGLLSEIALVADIDSLEEDDAVVIMTLHSAKGLEFPCVFMGGMEDGIFPGYMVMNSDIPEDMEEERRLCYVGITRAKECLYLSAARHRMVHGETQYNKISRFIKEIPPELLKLQGDKSSLPAKEFTTIAREKGMNKPFHIKKDFTVNVSNGLDYVVGDYVRHIKFGKGMVTEILQGGRDYEVTVDFEKAGIKKMFASFAKLKKVVE